LHVDRCCDPETRNFCRYSNVMGKLKILINLFWRIIQINLIMDSLASLALATEDPHDGLLLRKPHDRNEYIISKKMFKHVIGQAVYQFIVIIILVFGSNSSLIRK